jgi:hypothetical protein
LHDRNDKESHAIGARCKFLGALFSTVHGAWFAEKHLHTLKSLNCTVGWCITRIRKSACSYGRPAKKKRPAKGLEDPIGSRTRHDFIIVWSTYTNPYASSEAINQKGIYIDRNSWGYSLQEQLLLQEIDLSLTVPRKNSTPIDLWKPTKILKTSSS